MTLIALAGGGALLYWLWPRAAKAGATLLATPGATVDEPVSAHFMLSEFLHSAKVPELARYRLTETERTNLKALAGNVLEPLRLWHGPMKITGGGRPESVRNAAGRTITQELQASDNPVSRTASSTSDHIPFAAADAVFINVKPDDLATYTQAFERAKASPHVRQVMLETVHDKAGKIVVSHLHLAAVTPTLPRLPDARRALVTLDGKVIPPSTPAPAASPAVVAKK